MPIKIVEKTLQNRKQVVNGEVISAVVAATVVVIKKSATANKGLASSA